MMSYALCGAAALNDLENLIIHNQAVGSKAGSIHIDTPNYQQPQDFGMFSLVNDQSLPENTEKDKKSSLVDIISIDSLNLPRLDFFKIDVEGMEIDALKGSRHTIEQHLPWCWIEYWKVNIEDIKAQFAGLDYTFFIMDKLNMLCAPTQKLAKSPLSINAKTC
jgi:FkbM family methyltransferase